MKPRIFFLLGISIMAFMVLCIFSNARRAYAGPEESNDRTLSPYFLVKSDDAAVDQLPLKTTFADVRISGVIADVLVTQIYKNEGAKPLEAIYVFPASTRAAVYGMKMTIGERVIVAKIDKREAARRQYEQARHEGRSASLLEQQRPNVFQMNVANIMPEDEIKVELNYTELIVPLDNNYEFVYPTVVGPRYCNRSEENVTASERWVHNPYLHQGEQPTYSFDINVTISTGLPIKELMCTSHKVTVNYKDSSVATVALDQAEKNGGNRDYILRYRLAGNTIQSGLLLYEGAKEKFFLLMMQPPKKVYSRDIPGREYIFIVDVSGSMHGFPLDISKKFLKDLIGKLRSSDCFNVLLFAGGSSVLADESLPATADNIKKAIAFIDKQQGGGGTELLPALKRALALKRAENFSRTIVIATDGYVTVEEETFDLIRENLGDANMFAFGIGTSVNRYLIEGMAHVGMGEPFIITKPDEAPGVAKRFRAMIQSPVLTQGKITFRGFDAYDIEPPALPDVLADRPVIVFGKWRGAARGKIELRGVTGDGKYSAVINVKKVKPSTHNAALRYLWARHRITLLSDYNKLRENDARIKEVTELGLTYNLLTAYTSFVALDSEIRNQDGKPTTVKQPLPLPQGVSDYAVGGSMVAKECAAPSYTAAQRLQKPDSTSSLNGKGSVRDDEDKAMKIRIEKVTVTAGLTQKEITAVLTRHLDELKGCVTSPAEKEKMTLTIVIKSDGTVKAVSVVPRVEMMNIDTSCVTKKVKAWRFPANADGREVSATLVLVYKT